MDTLRNEPEKFWYFNNGITALCDSVRKKPLGGNSRDSGIFECTNVMVVNGAQTVGAIAAVNAQHPSVVARALVPVRFISLEQCPEGFATEVTRATNTQNRIERRDFVSLDPEQERLKTELQLDGIQYVYKSGETAPPYNTGFDLVDATVALACSRGDISLALQAKREISKLWEDISRAPYRSLFNPSITGKHLWKLVRFQRAIDNRLNNEHSSRHGRDSMLAIHGNRFLAYRVFKKLETEGLIDSEMDSTLLNQMVSSITVDQLDTCICKANEIFPDSYLASLFKNQNKCKELDKAMTNQKKES
jgi:hypothetical protein